MYVYWDDMKRFDEKIVMMTQKPENTVIYNVDDIRMLDFSNETLNTLHPLKISM